MTFVEAVSILGRAALAVVAADFMSGLIHWVADTYGTEKTAIIGPWLVRPNAEHHRKPSALVSKSWWLICWDLMLGGAMIVVAAALARRLTWEVWLFVWVGGTSGLVHRWNHGPRRLVPAPVRWLQKLGVLQSPVHHGAHHRGDRNTHYCVVTPLVNRILDTTGFWRRIERLLVPPGAAPRRTDLAKAVSTPGRVGNRGRSASNVVVSMLRPLSDKRLISGPTAQ
jgi:plasmanylethanolamine desaturase